ncbi:MAG TPA: signal peptidase I [Microbacteriaceae bacterium]|nr:signal peptidase I [Microbacteriaceae bacterium]
MTRLAPRVRRAVNTASWVVFALALGTWLAFFRPVELGGDLSAVQVEGTSMEPTLHDGDYVFARHTAQVNVGDVIVYQVDDGNVHGRVIHRVVDVAPDGSITTQGDNRATEDPWTVTPDSVIGTYVLRIPGLGGVLTWSRGSPVLVGALAAALVALAFVPLRRRRFAPAMREALARATQESSRDAQSTGDRAALAASIIGVAVSASAVMALVASRSTYVALWVLSFAAFGCSAAFCWWVSTRIFDGAQLHEPERSRRVLRGRLWRVDALPDDESAAPVASALELRAIAEKYRLPVLHVSGNGGTADQFLVITDGHGWFSWIADGDDATQPSESK